MENFPRKNYADHYPVIKVVERDDIHKYIQYLDRYTHVIFTSKTAVDLLFKYVEKLSQICIAVGPYTYERLMFHQVKSVYPKVYTQEGIIHYLKTLNLEDSSFFLPRSSIARKKLDEFFTIKHIPFSTCLLYDTVVQKIEPIPNLFKYKEIVFTSPSTVDGFFQIFQKIPQNIQCTFIGPITRKAYMRRLC